MVLTTYRQKRNFHRTPEPSGARTAGKGWLYFVQKHDASHLHYDFRLQLGDRLLSWAVPKGPSLDPGVKRLAVHVEDHPVEYGAFEGTIPEGEYGSGTVMLWDRGTWKPDGDADRGYRQGKLRFTLHGRKLQGEWVLVRPAQRPGATGSRNHWLLFKVRDKFARPDGPDILQEQPRSVKTGRDLAQIASGQRRARRSNLKLATPARKKGNAAKPRRAATDCAAKPSAVIIRDALDASGAPRAPLPRRVLPQLATLVKQAPVGDEWFNETKFDGYRIVGRIDHGQVKLYSRNQRDWTARLPHLRDALSQLEVDRCILDGELVALEPNGASSFQTLQNAFREGRGNQLVYYVFDLLHLNGRNTATLPLEQRKALLEPLLSHHVGPLRYCGHVVGGAPEFFRAACKLQLEGIICKRRDRPYRPGRGADWLKLKCGHREEFVIGGFTPPAGSRLGFGALLVGYHNSDGKLIYAGRVGTGFRDELLEELAARLRNLEQPQSPFSDFHGKTGKARGVHWVRPKLVGQVAFSEWTRDGQLRHPAFLGLREDKPAQEVFRDRPQPLVAGKPKAAKTPIPSRTKRTTTEPASGLPGDMLLTHPDKVLYPDMGLTKADLAQYYVQVANWILPQIADRPLVLVRCPEGQMGECFYQKHARLGTPAALRRIPIVEKHKKSEYVVVDDLRGLLALVQISALEIHAWGSRADKLEQPDRLVFDLDPDPRVAWPYVVESALQCRAFFEKLDLATFVKTTGGKGLHIVLPISRRLEWEKAQAFCRIVAQAIVAADPARYTSNMSKAARRGRIFLDYLRNARGATAVAAYSTRARPGAPVSTPVTWQELTRLNGSNHFTVRNIVARLRRLKVDPWHDINHTRQSITNKLIRQLGGA